MRRVPYEDLIGLPFKLGGRDPATGVDCFWLLIELCRRAGIDLEDIAPASYADDSTRDAAAALEAFGKRWAPTTRERAVFGDVQLVRWPETPTSQHLHVAPIVELMPMRVLHGTVTTGVGLARFEILRPWTVGIYTHTGAA